MTDPRNGRFRLGVTGCATSLLVTGCAAGGTTTTSAATTSAPTTSATSAPAGSGEREVASLTPRALIAHAKGLTLIDTETGRPIHETEHAAFLRLADAGTGRHIVVTDGDTFRIYDAGIESARHGDHRHRYEYAPGLTQVSYPAPKAGHVVVHGGTTALFADGTGAVQFIPTTTIAEPNAPVTKFSTANAHHGVTILLTDGSVLTTQGTKEARNTVEVIKDGTSMARTTDCPGVHGEAVATPVGGKDVAVLGCQNGPVVLRAGAFHKVPVSDAYSRSGNLAGTLTSPIVLGDYKVNPDATEEEPERPTRIALIDTRTAKLNLVELGSAYWFRSLARGPAGEGLVLTYDGALVVIDVATGKVTRRIPAIAPWREKSNWQEPGPVVKVAGSRAYVTDAERKELVVIDVRAGTVSNRFPLDHAPVEMAVVTGQAPGH